MESIKIRQQDVKNKQWLIMITARVTAQSVNNVRNYNATVIKTVRKALKNSIWTAAGDGVKASNREIAIKVDRPTRFTKTATGRLVLSSGPKVGGKVYIKQIQAKYLQPMIDGMTVNKKKPIPFKAIQNRYGNMPRGFTKRANVSGAKINGKSFVVTKRGGKSEIVGVWSERRRYQKRINWRPAVDAAIKMSLQRSARAVTG